MNRFNKQTILNNHALVIEELCNEIVTLKAELVQCYKKEDKLLTILASRDKQIDLFKGGDGKTLSDQNKSPSTIVETSETERRYKALSQSQLGRLQLKYWGLRMKMRNK